MTPTTLVAYENQFFDEQEMPQTRRERKRAKRAERKQKTQLTVKAVEPKTQTQEEVFESYYTGQNIMLHGVAGTGKTFVSMFLGLNDIISGYGEQNKIVVVRSVVPTRDMGFLPGNQTEKSKVYELPYQSIVTELCGRGEAYETLKRDGKIEFISTSFVRGLTFNDSIIIVDECQNLTFHELDSIITRVGENCRILFCGDFRQSDLERDHEKQGVLDFINIITSMKSFDFVEFTKEDIVRSPLVKDYIISKLNNGIHT
jgi:phosphate starvation-inducible protein PhoH